MNYTSRGSARTVRPEGESDKDAREIVQILDEYLVRLESGEPMDREELLASHPELAEELSVRIDALDFMHGVAPQLADGTTSCQPDWPAGALSKCLGDFRILREIGRGGMGVVYEAEQESLGRRVALKVLPFAALMDSRQLQRFKNEARAAATLHHANIVPVYSVGLERGIHYFAMQLIEGSSLESILRQLREAKVETGTDSANATEQLEPNHAQSSNGDDTVPINALTTAYSRDRTSYFRQVARLAIDAAEALEHAHSQGIVHRDIKPANLLLDIDGRLWVTDFGLAKLDAETSMTMTGDVMGTLRYMSPEQASGKHHVIDPRCDIYSLGATLYELLALQPVFASTDRPRLLRQIAEQEPRRLRSIEHRIPPDLETIVLKTLQKLPNDRYDTAQDLADDLRRFLDQRAIQAKRPTGFTQAVRWSRHHIEALTAVAVVLIISLIAAGGLITSAYQSEMQQRERAEASLKLAKETVDTMYTRFAEKWLSQDAANSDVQREFLERAVAFYDQLSEREAIDPGTRLDMAQTKIRVGRMYHRLGGEERLELAARRLNEALSILKELPPKYREERDFQYRLAWCHYELQETIGNGQEADPQRRLQHLCDARRILTTLLDSVGNDDEAREGLTLVIGRQGRIHCGAGEYDKAKKLFVEARQIAEQIEDQTTRLRAIAHCDDSIVKLPPSHLSDVAQEKAALRAVEYWRDRHSANPRDPTVQNNLAISLNKLACSRVNSNTRVEEALLNLIDAAQILTEVVKEAPVREKARAELITYSWNLRLLSEKLDLDEPRWREVIEVQQGILEACLDDEDRLAAAEPLWWSLDGLARNLAEQGELGKALETADEFWELTVQQNAIRGDGKWPSAEIIWPNLRLCETFVKNEQRAAGYRHCMAMAQYMHGCVQATSVTPFDEEELRDRLLDAFIGTSKVYQLVADAWGPESLMAACRDAVARDEFGADELWPLQAIAEIDIGNPEQALNRIALLLEQEESLPVETLLYTLGTRLRSANDNYRQHAIEVSETLIRKHQAHVGKNNWQVPTLGAMAHSGLADAYQKLVDWPRVSQHSRLAVQLAEKALQREETDFRGNDVRGLSGENALNCANAYFQLREFEQSKPMASLAIERFVELLKDKPQNHEQRRELSRTFFRQAEAEYFTGCNEPAQRAYDNSVQNLRELLASDVTDHELEDRQELSGLLTRNPFSTSTAIDELKELSLRSLELAPDNPVVWHEAAWVDYRCGNLDGARSSFLRVLEMSEANGEQRRIALVGCALAEYGLDNEEAAREYFRQVVEAFEQAPDETVFGMHEHSTLTEVAKKLGQEAIVDRIFAEQ